VTRAAFLCAVFALALMPALSDAHLMPEGQGSTRIVGNKAYTLISVPVALLHGYDDDRNGAISVAEARAHAERLHEQIEQRVQLFGDDVAARTVYKDLQVPHWDSSSAVQSAAVIQIRVSEWDTPPRSLRLRADVFTRKDRELYFRAILGDSTEAVTLTGERREAGFFGARVAGTSPASLLRPGLTLAVLVTIALALLSARARRVQPAQ
jgi:hypothetical protein